MKLAQRVGARANRVRFILWGGTLGILTLLLLWVSVSSDEQSYSVRSAERGQTTGTMSKHAYAYQGLARLLRDEGLGGNAVAGNSPLNGVGLRIMLEPQMMTWGHEERLAFRDFLTSSSAPVLLVPHVRASTRRTMRVDRDGFISDSLPKPLRRNTINEGLGFERQIEQASGLVQGRLFGFDVAIDEMLSFEDLWEGAETWAVDGRPIIYRQRIRNTEIHFLSDPDLLNNAGLALADNAKAAVALIETLKDNGTVVFDNRDIRIGTSSGYSFVGRLFDFPLGIVSGSILALSVILFWLTFGRFGPMMREDRALEAGKSTALEAAVAMLAGTGNNREVLRRYLDGQTRQLAARLGGPKTGDLTRLQSWLDAVAERRAVDDDLRLMPVAAMLNENDTILSEGQAARAAHTIHAFRSAMIHDT